MKRISCTFNCRSIQATFAVVVILSALICCATQYRGSDPPAADASSIAIESIEVFYRDNPVAPWHMATVRGGLIFNNDCQLRIVACLQITQSLRTGEIVRSVVLQRADDSLVLIDNQPLDDEKEIVQGKMKAVTYVLFPCFQMAPSWLKPGEKIILTLVISSGMEQVSKSAEIIYDLAE